MGLGLAQERGFPVRAEQARLAAVPEDPPAPRAPGYRVHLTDEATVVARGERVLVWFVRLADGWVRAGEHPFAVKEEISSERGDARCPPGTIWQRRVELELPPGTVLRATVSSPLQEKLSPVEYLTRGRSTKLRRVAHVYHRVVGNYRLELVKRRT